MANLINNIVKINRGDTYDLDITIASESGGFYELTGQDKLYFALMEAGDEFEDAILYKIATADTTPVEYDEDGVHVIEYHFIIESNDTAHLLPDTYYYTVKLELDHNIITDGVETNEHVSGVYTIRNRTKFIIMGATEVYGSMKRPRAVTLIDGEFDQNGTYFAKDAGADGYQQVTVNHQEPEGTLDVLTASENPLTIGCSYYANVRVALLDSVSDNIVSGEQILGVTGTHKDAVVPSVGRDSAVQNTINLPDDVDDHGNPIDRTNVANGAFSSAFGSRNITGELASESFTVGGLNKNYGQDNLLFGYRNESWANQNLTGGYQSYNYGAESLVLGSNVELDGNITYDEDSGDPKSDTKSCAVIGTNIIIGSGSKNSLIVGRHIWQDEMHGHIHGPDDLKNSFIIGDDLQIHSSGCWLSIKGHGHYIGADNECVYVNGYDNGTADNITDSVIFGYANSIENKGRKESGKEKYVYIFGHENSNKWDNESATDSNSNVYIFGTGLNTTKDNQFIVGTYNAGVPNALVEFGSGTDDENRSSSFAIVYGDSLVSGSTSLNDYVETSCVIGWDNTVNTETYGAAIFGNYNTLGNASEVDYSFISGAHNTVTHNCASAFGQYLTSTANNQMTVGKYNSISSSYDNTAFQVGTGTSDSNRKTSFAVFSNKVQFPTYSTIGTYGATTEFVQTYVNNVVGDINSILDDINGEVI